MIPKPTLINGKRCVIEHGVPIPPASQRDDGVASLFRAMGPGDSVVLPANKRNCIGSVAKAVGVKVTARKIDEKTFRVWRTA